MSDGEKVRENRLRRAADRQGKRLVKSRRRDPRAVDFGRFWIIDIASQTTEAGGPYGLSLDDVERLLEGTN